MVIQDVIPRIRFRLKSGLLSQRSFWLTLVENLGLMVEAGAYTREASSPALDLGKLRFKILSVRSGVPRLRHSVVQLPLYSNAVNEATISRREV